MVVKLFHNGGHCDPGTSGKQVVILSVANVGGNLMFYSRVAMTMMRLLWMLRVAMLTSSVPGRGRAVYHIA